MATAWSTSVALMQSTSCKTARKEAAEGIGLGCRGQDLGFIQGFVSRVDCLGGSMSRGLQYRPQCIVVRVMQGPKKGVPNFRNLPFVQGGGFRVQAPFLFLAFVGSLPMVFIPITLMTIASCYWCYCCCCCCCCPFSHQVLVTVAAV